MNNMKLRAVPDNELHEVIGYILYDLHSFSKEFEWHTHGNIVNLEIPQFIQDSKLPIVRKYFSTLELGVYSQKLFDNLEKLLSELSSQALEIEDLTESDKEKLVAFIKKELDLLSMQSSFDFPQKFREILFIELGIDYVDDIGEVKEEVKFILSKIMQK